MLIIIAIAGGIYNVIRIILLQTRNLNSIDAVVNEISFIPTTLLWAGMLEYTHKRERENERGGGQHDYSYMECKRSRRRRRRTEREKREKQA